MSGEYGVVVVGDSVVFAVVEMVVVEVVDDVEGKDVLDPVKNYGKYFTLTCQIP